MKRKPIMFSLFGVFCLAIAVLLLLSSCGYSKYRGEHEDLYTVAVNNLFGISGHTSNGEVPYDPEVSVIETDNYGRVLFFYNENYGNNDFSMAFVIMQKSENGYVYYYQDVCYVPFYDDSDYFYHGRRNSDDYIRAVERSFDKIEALKEQNDWNKELNSNKCTKAKISNKMPEGKIRVQSWTFDPAIYSYAKANGYQGSDMRQCRIMRFCNRDTTGKELYYVYCMTADDDVSGQKIYGHYVYAVIVDQKNIEPIIGDHAIVEIKDPATYHETIKKLKEQNNWQ